MSNTAVLDEHVLELLADQLGDVTVLCTFVARYAEMLSGRVERVQVALSTHDMDALADAALSLKTSSEMTGAKALSKAATALLDDMSHAPAGEGWPPHDAAAVVVVVDRLQRLATQTYQVLQTYLESQTAEVVRRAGSA